MGRPSALARILGLVLPLSVLMSWCAPETLAQTGGPGNGARVLYQKQRNFRIPINLSASQKDRIREVILCVSEDAGASWKAVSRTDTSHPAFSFRAGHDGEFWFTLQVRTKKGKVSPSLDAVIEPKLKVIIDTMPPELILEPEGRRGSWASVRWEVRDEALVLRSIYLEYQVEGVGVWNRVPIRNPRRIGAQRWDAGTAESLRVRMSVSDEAGNVTTAMLQVPDGTGTAPEAGPEPAEDPGPPRIEQVAGSGPNASRSEISAGEGFTPVGDAPPGRPEIEPANTKQRNRPARSRNVGTDTLTASRSAPTRNRPSGGPADLFRTAAQNDPGFGNAPTGAAQPPANKGGNAPNAASTLLVDSPRFRIQYAVEDAGPSGPATVELWITRDGGRSWIRRGDDPDRTSPIDVDLGGEGTYGIWLVARSSAGLGDRPPAPGDAPQSWVEVDATPPVVQLDRVQVGEGPNTGKIAILWRASDLHLVPQSVAILWREDRAGAPWNPIVDGQKANGRYIWTVPQNVPARFHIRVEAADSVGHRGFADSTDTGPIMVDRSRPHTRIIGLDPNARSGMGPSSWPLR